MFRAVTVGGGMVYAGGDYTESARWGDQNLTSHPFNAKHPEWGYSHDAVTAAYRQSDGQLLWVKGGGGTAWDRVNSLAFAKDTSGVGDRIYLAADFYDNSVWGAVTLKAALDSGSRRRAFSFDHDHDSSPDSNPDSHPNPKRPSLAVLSLDPQTGQTIWGVGSRGSATGICITACGGDDHFVRCELTSKPNPERRFR